MLKQWMNSRLDKYFDEYKETHCHPTNLLIHKIAVPFIIFHIVAMLKWIKFFDIFLFELSFAQVAILFVSIFYLSLNILYAFYMILFFILCFFISIFTPIWLVWFVAFVAWTFQFIGHYFFEKKSPAFSKNFIQILIGPLFILSQFFERKVILQDTKQSIR